ncbi:VOC family protein [Curvibacter sp. HBC28]|uniref:VOC family protein n=1 Tax=Curvibacter microcysteis TaxID=3026419 RepID=A0ABT5MHZ3_9BURK|nr:VOC family protein [Curvibacter sp. HBC28]MDD0814800.1 VOC family protein [Curvibacter sp. HBC28]
MLDHMTFRVTDIQRAKAFYSAALAPLDYSLSYEGFHGVNILGFGYPDAAEPTGQKSDVWFIDGPSPHGGPPATTGCHLAWRASSRAQVDAFYQAAIAAGGRDNGAPGLRPDYHPDYYGAFVIDPEGNNIEAVCHLPA